MIALITVLIFVLLYSSCPNHEPFVPYNTYEVPENISPQKWQAIHKRFGQLSSNVPSTCHWCTEAIKSDAEDLSQMLLYIINSLSSANYIILYVGEETQFSLLDVYIQNTGTLQVNHFPRIDFVMSSTKPYTVEDVIMMGEAPKN